MAKGKEVQAAQLSPLWRR